MYNDSFKSRYTTIPFATYEGMHKSDSHTRSTLLHCHREMELLLILEGEGVFVIDGREYPAVAGDLITVSPYHLHATRFVTGKPYHSICLCFDLSLLHDRALSASLEDGKAAVMPYLPYTNPETSRAAVAVRAAFNAHANGEKGWEFAVVGALCEAFSAFVAHDRIVRQGSGEDRDDFCYRALAFLEAHVSDPVTSTDAAEALYLSHGHFCRTFRAKFGYPFGEYLMMLRIERAEHLLCDTDWRISRVAECVGFENFSYFSKCFRESTGMTPIEYRRRWREERE